MAAMLAVIPVSVGACQRMGGGHRGGYSRCDDGQILPGYLYSRLPVKITNTDDLALGHFGSVGYLLSALVGKEYW